jgi:hypothetical protein
VEKKMLSKITPHSVIKTARSFRISEGFCIFLAVYHYLEKGFQDWLDCPEKASILCFSNPCEKKRL